jgi:hypothetical protein
MSAIEFGGDVLAFRSGLQILTNRRLSQDFDERVMAGLRRPPTWKDALLANVRVLAPAMACGAGATLFLLQIALQTPTAPTYVASSGPAQTIDVDKLMYLIDKPNQCVASMSLLQQCIEPAKAVVTTPAKVEPTLERRASAGDAPVLV